MFHILHINDDSLIAFMGIDKILAIGHDLSTRKRGIHMFESSPGSTRCGGGRDKLHEGGRYRLNNDIEKKLVLLEPENMIRIWGRGSGIR